METKSTLQGIVVLNDKKRWENPTLVVIDSNSINSGNTPGGVESAFTTIGIGTKVYLS